MTAARTAGIATICKGRITNATYLFVFVEFYIINVLFHGQSCADNVPEPIAFYPLNGNYETGEIKDKLFQQKEVLISLIIDRHLLEIFD